jgi:hypothetical protein
MTICVCVWTWLQLDSYQFQLKEKCRDMPNMIQTVPWNNKITSSHSLISHQHKSSCFLLPDAIEFKNWSPTPMPSHVRNPSFTSDFTHIISLAATDVAMYDSLWTYMVTAESTPVSCQFHNNNSLQQNWLHQSNFPSNDLQASLVIYLPP